MNLEGVSYETESSSKKNRPQNRAHRVQEFLDPDPDPDPIKFSVLAPDPDPTKFSILVPDPDPDPINFLI